MNNLKIHTFEQGSDEWFEIRKGKMTASHAQAIGNCGKGLDTYIIEIMSELSSSAEKESFSNAETDRGNELEPAAREAYEFEKGAKINQVGFIEASETVGCSPDGLIGEDGGIEIKCPKDKVYFKMIIGGEKEIDKGYLWQVQMNLLITGRAWWDIAFYNPNYGKSIMIFRILPDIVMQSKIKEGIVLGNRKIAQIKEILKAT